MYLALYRKYRPQNFEEVIGQDHIVKTLKNQIMGDKIGHAYLFCGSRGTGKTSTAKIFARAINCQNSVNGSPCGKCETCKSLASNNLDVLEIDAASNNGVDEIRDLREKVKYPPVNGKYKVYIVDEVHMLSPSAFNALLKTLEEPPSYAVFILATTEVHKLPATILSRCLRFDFTLVSVDDLVKLLEKIFKQEKINAEKEALELIARAGEGSVRDTLSIADRCVSYSGENLTYSSVVEVLGTTEKEELSNIAASLLSGNLGESLRELDVVLSKGKSPAVLSKDLIGYFRDLLVVMTLGAEAKKMVVASPKVFETMKSQAQAENYHRIVMAINTLSEVEAELRYSISPRIVLETAFVKTLTSVDLIKKVDELEKRIEALQCGSVLSQGRPEPIRENAMQTTSEAPKEKMATEQKAEPQIPAPKNDNELLGKLLNFLRERKDMSLLTCLRQVSGAELNGKNATFYFDDEMNIEIVNKEKYRRILNEFFGTLGIEYSFKLKEQRAKGDERELERMLGEKLNKID